MQPLGVSSNGLLCSRFRAALWPCAGSSEQSGGAASEGDSKGAVKLNAAIKVAMREEVSLLDC